METANSLYTMDMSLIASFFLICAAASSQAKDMEAVLGKALPDSRQYDQLGSKVDTLRDAVANSHLPDSQIYGMSHDIFDRLSQTAVKVAPERHDWDYGAAPEKTQATIGRLAKAMRNRINDFEDIPSPELIDTANTADAMILGGKVSFNDKMAPNEMGAYEYLIHKAEAGVIRLNEMLSWIATEIGDEFATATLVHEGRHRLDHANGKISVKEWVATEVSAFKTEFLYLVTNDPTGERLAYRRSALNFDQNIEPTQRRAAAIAYANHLAELRSTGGDEGAIKKIVERDYGDAGNDRPVRD